MLRDVVRRDVGTRVAVVSYAMRSAFAFALACLTGCAPIFGLDTPVIGDDDTPDPAVDAAVTRGCPAKYTITLPSSTTRYRVLESKATFAEQDAACRSDPPGATRLVAFESASEAQYLRELLTQYEQTRYYVGASQSSNQARPEEGWRLATGGPVSDELWALEQPIDGPSSHYFEDNEANVAELALDTTSGMLFDASGKALQPAICECDP